MQVRFTKGKDRDFIAGRRSDGTSVNTTFPKKGLFPHDAVHLLVEKRLQFRHGFWGRVAAGATPEEIAGIAKAGGHASSARALQPAADITELLHSERLVECFEAELWSEGSDNALFRSALEAACSQSKLPSPGLSDEVLGAIRGELQQAVATWRKLGVGESMSLEF
jgi:hypothetical protein